MRTNPWPGQGLQVSGATISSTQDQRSAFGAAPPAAAPAQFRSGLPQPTAVPLPLESTDPDNVLRSIEPVLGRSVAELIREQMVSAMRELGLTEVDRRFLAFPDMQAEGAVEEMLTDRRAYHDRTPQEHLAVRRAMDVWFRAVLFGTQVKDDGLRSAFENFHARVMSEGTDSAGGYLVPPGFIAEVIMDAAKLSQLFQYVRKIPVSVNTGEIPNEATDVTVAWGTENNDFGGTDPAFGSSTWTVYRLNAICKMSREVVADSNPGIVDTISELFRRKIMEERDRVIAAGTGSGQPMGLVNATNLTDFPFAQLNYDNLVGLMASVDHRYYGRPTTRWQMRQSVFMDIQKLKDDEGRPLIHFNPQEGFKPYLFGHGISIESGFPATYVGFGDLSYYLWFDREQLGVERTTQAGDSFAKHQMWIKFWERAGGLPVVGPVKPLARNTVLGL